MASATVLNLGDDLCYRIPLMERAGLHAVRAECSVSAVRKIFEQGDPFSAVVFHVDFTSGLVPIVAATRILSTAPLILFQNSFVDCDERLFDLVVRVQTPPDVWLKSLEDLIEGSRRLRQKSEQLRQDCEQEGIP
jgi:hypothetical protein